jgi:hypothetical protein
VRKVLLFPLLLLALGLAACGGGSSSSGTTSGSGTTSASKASSAEAVWAKEVEKLMEEFEGQVTARLVEPIHTTASQPLVEPLYREYGADLHLLGKKLEATDAPRACVAMRKRMAADAHALGQLNAKLGHESKVSPEEFAALAVVAESKMHRYGRDLTGLVVEPHC